MIPTQATRGCVGDAFGQPSAAARCLRVGGRPDV